MRSDHHLVLLTRDDERLASILTSRGASVVTLPCVQIEPADPTRLAAELRSLTSDDVLVVTSRAGVDAIAAVVDVSSIPCPIAVVGMSTAARLGTSGGVADFVPSAASGARLGRELALPRGEVVLARSDRALDDIAGVLRARGARVREIVAYRTRAEARGDPTPAREALEHGATVVLASPSALEGLLAAVGVAALKDARIVAIGPTTAEAVAHRLGASALVAASPSPDALADLVLQETHVSHG